MDGKIIKEADHYFQFSILFKCFSILLILTVFSPSSFSTMRRINFDTFRTFFVLFGMVKYGWKSLKHIFMSKRFHLQFFCATREAWVTIRYRLDQCYRISSMSRSHRTQCRIKWNEKCKYYHITSHRFQQTLINANEVHKCAIQPPTSVFAW